MQATRPPSDPPSLLPSTMRRAREVVESLNMHMPPRPGEVRIVESRFAIVLGENPDPNLNVVQRLRLDPRDDVERTVHDVRRLAESHGRRKLTWEVGSSSAPGDLHARLLRVGMVPHQPDPQVTCMLLSRPAEVTVPAGVEVRLVETREDFAAASRVLAAGFGMPASSADMFGTFEQHRAQPHLRTYLACIDGEPIAAANATSVDVGMVLSGGATLKSARGRGAYRALVAARFRDAERQSSPLLLTQAGAMSRPILERLGFEKVAEVQILSDSF